LERVTAGISAISRSVVIALRAVYFSYNLLRVYSVTGYEGDAVGYHHSLEANS
jgi:hypothetical protein